MKRSRALGGISSFVAVIILSPAAGGALASHRASGDNTGWSSFGNTVDQNRHSPLTQIKPSNLDQLGRVFTFDLSKAVPGIKKGQQSYPIVVGDRMYVTSGDDQVFALKATTGELLWRYAPDNLASFKNYGIVANRGVAVCDGRVFLLTLDTSLERLVALAKLRWRIEQDYRELKDALGLDHFEGRSWPGWHHHVTLVSVAHGFLTCERLRRPSARAAA